MGSLIKRCMLIGAVIGIVVVGNLGFVKDFSQFGQTLSQATSPLVIKSEGCSTDYYLTVYGTRELALDTDFGLECVVLLTNDYAHPVTTSIEVELVYTKGGGSKGVKNRKTEVTILPHESRYKAFEFGDMMSDQILTVSFVQGEGEMVDIRTFGTSPKLEVDTL